MADVIDDDDDDDEVGLSCLCTEVCSAMGNHLGYTQHEIADAMTEAAVSGHVFFWAVVHGGDEAMMRANFEGYIAYIKDIFDQAMEDCRDKIAEIGGATQERTH